MLRLTLATASRNQAEVEQQGRHPPLGAPVIPGPTAMLNKAQALIERPGRQIVLGDLQIKTCDALGDKPISGRGEQPAPNASAASRWHNTEHQNLGFRSGRQADDETRR